MRPFVAIVAAAVLSTSAAAAEHQVKIVGMKFEPAVVTVSAGDEITWTNADIVSHTVVGPGLKSPVVKPGERFTWTAEKSGAVEYTCSLHPTMRGSIQVQ